MDSPETPPDLSDLRGRVDALTEEVTRLQQLLSEIERLLARTSGRPMAGYTRPHRTRAAFDPGSVKALYSRRFDPRELRKKRAIWKHLTRYFQKRFPVGASSLLELGAGEGEFLEHTCVVRKVAIDLNPAVHKLAAQGIETVQGDITRLYEHFDDETFDVVFCSNVLEHLYDKDQVHLVFREVHHVLGPRGRFLLLQPNFRFVGPAYYDFIDHRLELTAEAIVEALEVNGFRVLECLPRFIPYTSKSRLSSFYWLVPAYVRLPFAWRIFGKQAFLVAEKVAHPSPTE